MDYIENALIISDQGNLYWTDIENSIAEFKQQMLIPEDLENSKSMAFNNLLRYIHRQNIKPLLPNTRRHDYRLLDDIFNNIYLPLCYTFNRVPSVHNFIVHLIQYDLNNVYDIKAGVYRSYGSKVNAELQRFVSKWDSACDSDLLDYIVHTSSIGGIFRAKTKGFREEQKIVVEVGDNAPTLDTMQINTAVNSGFLPLPDDTN